MERGAYGIQILALPRLLAADSVVRWRPAEWLSVAVRLVFRLVGRISDWHHHYHGAWQK